MTREEIRALEDRADETKEDVKPAPDVCRWRPNHDTDSLHSPLHHQSGYYTSAGFSIPAKWHTDDGFRFCPYCGKRIEVVA